MAPLLALLLFAAGADSATLTDDGLRAFEEMDLDGARALLGKAQRAAPPAERPRVELWLGIVELERGNDGAARRWLRSALQGDPALAVPASVSPKVHAMVDELRATLRAPPQVRAANRARPTGDPGRLEGARRAPVAGPAASATASAPTTTTATVGTAALTLPEGVAATATQPAIAASSEPGAAAAPTSTPLGRPSSLVLAGAGAGALAAGALGGGVLLGALAQDAAASAQREVRAADAAARYRDASATAWVANGLYAVGVVAAAVGVGCATLELAGVGE